LAHDCELQKWIAIVLEQLQHPEVSPDLLYSTSQIPRPLRNLRLVALDRRYIGNGVFNFL
jgi:hypothetical protein